MGLCSFEGAYRQWGRRDGNKLVHFVVVTSDLTGLLLTRANFPQSCFCHPVQLCSACAQEAPVLGLQRTEQREPSNSTPKATAFPHSRVVGQSRSHDQADVGGPESAVLCRAGRVGGESLRDLKHTVYYACLSVFFWRQVLGSPLRRFT